MIKVAAVKSRCFRQSTGRSAKREKRYKHLLLWLLLVLPALLLAGCASEHVIHDSPAWKFAVMSDTQGHNRGAQGKPCVNDAVVRRIAGDIVKEKVDFVLVAGDLVNGWFRNGGLGYAMQYGNWKAAMSPVYRAGIKIYAVRGNHDSGPERLALPPLPAHLEPPPGSAALLKEAFLKHCSGAHVPGNGPAGEVGLTYSFTHKNAFVVGLDQFDDHQHEVNLLWLKVQLSANRKPHVFVFGHEPAFRLRHRDCLAFYPEKRDAFWDAIGEAGGRLYFCGHDHLYNRAVISDGKGNAIRQIVAGTGGGRLVSWPGTYAEGDRVKGEYTNSDHHGYVLVTVDRAKVTVSWKALVHDNGTQMFHVLDSFSYGLSASSGMEQ
jgi:hypothetical protein